eukprot:CAMPEP_0182441938 /NCGR_PEP_ID=MMETSP1172-20130603/916_1 /TAXON_ID=708627 /ORGANISM="Timspurckia oligopyrenoides, Strain CCMP3278" /LENGTH=259 /DNA_ID=CAMNT_0024636543 /DNA_START=410 /DNA_END=1189 /DNA_ORIENTATION=+
MATLVKKVLVSVTEAYDEKFSEIDFHLLAASMRNSIQMKTGFAQKSDRRRWFYASDAVKWLIAENHCSNSLQAQYLGDVLVESGYIYRADDSTSGPFQNRMVAYRFSFDDKRISTMYDTQEIHAIVNRFIQDLNGKVLWHENLTVKRGAYGTEIVDWFLDSGYAKNRGEACSFSDYLYECGMLDVYNEKPKGWQSGTEFKNFSETEKCNQFFKDSEQIYRLSSAFRKNLKNLGGAFYGTDEFDDVSSALSLSLTHSFAS